MESAYFRYSSTLEVGTAQENFSTPFLALTVTSLGFTGILAAAAGPLMSAMSIPADQHAVYYCSLGMLCFDAMTIVPFASLRMEHRARKFALIKFLNILITVLLNIVLLLWLKMGVKGIFVSGLVASGATLLMLLPTILRNLAFRLNPSLMKALLAFGLPLVPSGIATMAVQVIDRPILRGLTDDATVGIYQANYRLGIFMMLIVQMYDYAWRPFFFSAAKQPNAKEVFARVLTYLILFMVGVFLVLVFFLEDLVHLSFFGRHLIHPGYWSGLSVVPVVLLGYMFLGVSTNLSAGLYLEKKTSYNPVITLLGALVNVLGLYILIPAAGILGAAWATLLAYAAMAAMLYVVVQRVYPVEYEWPRVGKIVVALAAVYGTYLGATALALPPGAMIVVKLLLVACFVLIIWALRFFEPRELGVVRDLILRPRGQTPPSGREEPRSGAGSEI
jgi:O-antigen/teichoic acid export membrane protein